MRIRPLSELWEERVMPHEVQPQDLELQPPCCWRCGREFRGQKQWVIGEDEVLCARCERLVGIDKAV